jgi:ABC-type transport system involved in cytochrome bd biosynthesis fused ATPase/permease subunit
MPVVFADYGLGEALLTVLSIFFLVIFIWILIVILTDLFRDHELSGWWKAIWAFFLIVFPYITAFIYLIARGKGMRERQMQDVAEAQKESEAYIRRVAGSSPVDELHKLNELKEKGAISQAEFDQMKSKLMA